MGFIQITDKGAHLVMYYLIKEVPIPIRENMKIVASFKSLYVNPGYRVRLLEQVNFIALSTRNSKNKISNHY